MLSTLPPSFRILRIIPLTFGQKAESLPLIFGSGEEIGLLFLGLRKRKFSVILEGRMPNAKSLEPKVLTDEKGRPTHVILPIKLAEDFFDSYELARLVKTSKKSDFILWKR